LSKSTFRDPLSLSEKEKTPIKNIQNLSEKAKQKVKKEESRDFSLLTMYSWHLTA
jgi:hypothetical protein